MSAIASSPDARFNLILISNPAINEWWDFADLAAKVHEVAPDIQTVVLEDRPWQASADFDRPTLSVSPGPVRLFRAERGPLLQGRMMSKAEEYAALERVGVTVPRWVVLTQDTGVDLAAFGPYVVLKPDRGGRGADVKIMRKGRVRWRPPVTAFARSLSGPNGGWIVQEFVYTGPFPVSFRVTTLFGEPLWAWQVRAAPTRRPLKHRFDFHDGEHGGGMSIVSSGRGCTFAPVTEPDLLDIARRSHSGFPDVPLIGVDILRDAETGEYHVIEVNAVGYTWHLTSPLGRAIQQQFGFDLDAHFDVRRKAARLLADLVHQRAA